MQKQEFEFRKCLENGKKGESDVFEILSKAEYKVNPLDSHSLL